MNKILEPSLLAFSKDYISEIKALIPLGIKQIHFDIMDGEYVPNVSIFDETAVYEIKKLDLNVSIHLMGYNFLITAKKYLNAGIVAMTFQFEALLMRPELKEELIATFKLLKEHNIKCGIAFNPNTSFKMVEEWIKQSDIVTVMTVVAGKGGQAFCPDGLINLNDVYQYQQTSNPNLIIQIDGGVNLNNLDLFLDKVNFVVSGSSFYQANEATKKLMINKVHNL